MHLWCSSNALYMSILKSRSRVGGYHFLDNKPLQNIPFPDKWTFINTTIHVKASILRNIISTASESEIVGAYVNTRIVILIKINLLEIGHPQYATPLEVDNNTAIGILTKQLIPKQSKVMNMRFYWLWDRNNQKQFNIYWNKGDTNLANYFTKMLMIISIGK